MANRQVDRNSVVYILGAGASKAVIPNSPLMAQLLPEILRMFEEKPATLKGFGAIEFVED